MCFLARRRPAGLYRGCGKRVCAPGDEGVNALVELRHEAREGLPCEVSSLAVHIVLQLMLPLSPPLQGS